MNRHRYQAAAELINTKLEQLTESIMQRSGIYENTKYSAYQTQKCRQDTLYNLRYLAESLAIGSVGLWESYVRWLILLLGPLGINMVELADHFRMIAEVLRDELDEEAAQYTLFLTAQAENLILGDTPVQDPAQDPANLHYESANHYQKLLLSSQKHQALDFIDDLLEKGIPCREIYLNILQPVQREIGNLWHANKISVAQEHYCSGITQLVIAKMYPRMFDAKPRKHKMVSTCVSGELHELGLRMVTDIMELDGWDTCYLGANMPHEGIVSTIKEKKVDLIAISVTFPLNLHKAQSLISQIRAEAQLDGVKILVGGYPFLQDPLLWQKIGADSFAPDANIASRIATSLVEGAI
jgi:methanogenic corrinoid protein MtbC1